MVPKKYYSDYAKKEKPWGYVMLIFPLLIEKTEPKKMKKTRRNTIGNEDR